MLRSVLFTTLLALSASATAQDFDYNYFSIGYQRSNYDDGVVDVDGDVFSASGSFELNESFYVFAGYGTGDLESVIDIDNLSVGLGWHTPLADKLDLTAGLSYEYVDYNVAGFGNVGDDNGLGPGLGLRQLTQQADPQCSNDGGRRRRHAVSRRLRYSCTLRNEAMAAFDPGSADYHGANRQIVNFSVAYVSQAALRGDITGRIPR